MSRDRRRALALIRREIAKGANVEQLQTWAREMGVKVKGTGSNGGVTKDDLLAAFAAL